MSPDTTKPLPQIKSSEAFQKYFNVSRETIEKLEIYVAALTQWQKKINLISGQTIHDVWQRHIADSAQLYYLSEEHYLTMTANERCYDFGSGAGFPGLVMAILADDQEGREGQRRDKEIGARFSLIEGSAKKCAFLREVVRNTQAPAEIINKRIESLSQISNSVNTKLITARALASLNNLFELSEPVWSPKTKAYFLKGSNFRSEIDEAEKYWSFALNQHPSLTSQDSIILEISALCRKE